MTSDPRHADLRGDASPENWLNGHALTPSRPSQRSPTTCRTPPARCCSVKLLPGSRHSGPERPAQRHPPVDVECLRSATRAIAHVNGQGKRITGATKTPSATRSAVDAAQMAWRGGGEPVARALSHLYRQRCGPATRESLRHTRRFSRLKRPLTGTALLISPIAGLMSARHPTSLHDAPSCCSRASRRASPRAACRRPG